MRKKIKRRNHDLPDGALCSDHSGGRAPVLVATGLCVDFNISTCNLYSKRRAKLASKVSSPMRSSNYLYISYRGVVPP